MTGFNSDGTTSCTATESATPTGYSSTGTCTGLIGLAGGSCTIVNTLNSATLTVSRTSCPTTSGLGDGEPVLSGHAA